MARPVARRGESRERVLDAALALFSEHGVSGTSLQMIATALGVTKAAVYHQFQTKEEIVLAVLSPALDQMASFIETAEAQRSRRSQLDATLVGLVDLVVSHRTLAPVLGADPAVVQLLQSREPFRGLIQRLGRLLAGPDPEPATRVAVSVFGGGLMLSGTDPNLQDIDEDTLRRELLISGRRLLQIHR